MALKPLSRENAANAPGKGAGRRDIREIMKAVLRERGTAFGYGVFCTAAEMGLFIDCRCSLV